jgi:hypothetical protein
MGADKNSSPKRELGIYPKFTTKDSHTSLPRSRSHSEPTNPRNKSQTIPKWKHESRSKGLSCPATTLEDSPGPRGGRSAVTGQTVRYPWMDGTLIATERPDEHPNTRMVRATRAARTVRDIQADGPPNTSRPKTASQPDQNENAQECATNTKNNWTNFTMRTVRLLPADGPPGTGTAARA